jgi:hypothetical protein
MVAHTEELFDTNFYSIRIDLKQRANLDRQQILDESRFHIS